VPLLLIALVGPGCDDGSSPQPPAGPAQFLFRTTALATRNLAALVTDPEGNAFTAEFRGDGYRVTADGVHERLRTSIRLGSDRVEMDSDNDGHPLFASWFRGIARLDDLVTLSDWSVFTATEGCLPSNFVTTVRGDDASGALLVGLAHADGMLRIPAAYPEEPCVRWTESNSTMTLGSGAFEGDGWIGGISQSRDGVRWVGVREDGLHRWDDNGTPADPSDDLWTAFRPAAVPQLTSTIFHHLNRDADGAVWVATNDGLIIIRDGLFVRAPTLASPNVNHITFGPNGHAWVATGAGVSVLARDTLQEMARYDISTGLPSSTAAAVAFAPSGDWAYIATAAGLAILDRVD
jgi:hypothetical protein